MREPSTSSEILAHWRYRPGEWKKFGAYESRHWQRVLKQSRTGFFVLLAFTFIALLLVPIFGLAGIVPWDRYMLMAVFLILLFGGAFMGIAVVVWMMQKSKLATLTADSGDVSISTTGISMSGASNDWNFGDLRGHRFYDARTMTIADGKPDQMELLEVRTIAYTVGHSNRDVITSLRVPIPSGKRAEAERIVERLITEKKRAELESNNERNR